MTHWSLILIAATANVLLNIFLSSLGRSLSTNTLREIVVGVLSSPWTWAAFVSACVLLTAFVAAIRLYSLSMTYTAVTAIAMVTLTGLAVALRIETLSLMRGIGLGLIVSGLLVTAAAD